MKIIIEQVILSDRDISSFLSAALGRQDIIKLKPAEIPCIFNALLYPFNCIEALNELQEVIVCDQTFDNCDDVDFSDYSRYPGEVRWNSDTNELELGMYRSHIEYRLRELVAADIDSDDFEMYKLQQKFYDVFVKQEFIFEKCWPLLQYIIWDEVRFPVED